MFGGPNGRVLTAPALALPLNDTSAIDLTLVRGDEVWDVRFDGFRATAVRATAPR